MNKEEPKCTLSNEELVVRVNALVSKLCETGGKSWGLSVPVNFNRDPDMLIIEMGKRLLKAYTPDESRYKKAIWWIANGSVGASSKTMWNCLIGNEDFSINHPYDPDDFSRCWKLLEAVPEWKPELHKLKPLSRQWSNLVDNWG